jgi:hypothetical protein
MNKFYTETYHYHIELTAGQLNYKYRSQLRYGDFKNKRTEYDSLEEFARRVKASDCRKFGKPAKLIRIDADTVTIQHAKVTESNFIKATLFCDYTLTYEGYTFKDLQEQLPFKDFVAFCHDNKLNYVEKAYLTNK